MAVQVGTQRPPTATAGPLAWLRKNLFSSWYNTLLTLVTLWLLYTAVSKTLIWALTEAKWLVVIVNLRLFMVGAYPDAAFWRLWTAICLVGLFGGISWAAWGRWRTQVAAGVLAASLLLALGPVDLDTRIWWMLVGLSLPAGYFIGRALPSLSRRAWVLWLLSFPLIMVLVRGFKSSTALPYAGTAVWNGLLLTVLLAIIGIVLSFPLGVLLALGRRSSLPAVRVVSILYIEVIRGVPLIGILFMGTYIIPIFLPPSWRLDLVLRALIAVTMFSAAYLAENVRGGLQAIPKGQEEAAKALGLKGWHAIVLIVLPQALRAVIPTLVGQFIGLFKDTSLVVIVSLIDLMGIAKSILAQPDFLGRHVEVYAFCAFIYFAFSYTLSYASRRLEKALGVGER